MKHLLKMALASACLLSAGPLRANDAAQASAAADGATPAASPVAAAWDRYYAEIAKTREALEASPQFKEFPEQRQRGYHALIEAQAMVYNFAIAPRTLTPRVFRNTGWQTEIYTLGGNGADFDYRQLFLDGHHTYRLTGNMRGSRVILGQLSGTLPGGDSPLHTNYDWQDFKVNADGSFEVILSAQKQPGNWIQLDPDSEYQWIQFRPTVDTWDGKPAEFKVERISADIPGYLGADADTPEAVARRIDRATGYLHYITAEWTTQFYPRTKANAGGPNIFRALGKQISGEVGSPTANYLMGAFHVGKDEALIVEVPEKPRGAYWSFQLFDVYLKTLNFRTNQSMLNEYQLQQDPDGKYRIVISATDPGVPNWLDTAGLTDGQFLMRDYRTTKGITPVVTTVKLKDLRKHLYPKTPTVSPEQRAAELRARANGYLLRHGE